MTYARRRTRFGGSGSRTALAVAALLIAGTTSAMAAGNTAVTVGAQPKVKEPNPSLTAASFADPPTIDRPKYRWWLPVADESDSELRTQIQQIAKTGGGGAEVTIFAAPNEAGSTLHSSEQYLAEYGYGTAAWLHRVQVMETEARKDGIVLDFAAGPRWPPTSPTISNFNQSPVAQQVIYGKEFNAAGSTRTGALPDTLVQPPSLTKALCAPVTAGGTKLLLNSTQNLAVGDRITLGTATPETVKITKVGTSSPCTTLATATAAGASQAGIGATDTNLVAGVKVTIGSGSRQDDATVKTAGSAAVSTTTAASSAAGATSLVLTSVTGINVGDTVTVDSGAAVESAVVGAVTSSSRTITTQSPLSSAHASGAAITDAGKGITFTKPLKHAHPAGEQIIAPGSGITVSRTAAAHAIGDKAVDTAVKKLVSVEVAECSAVCDAATAVVSLDRSSVADVTARLDAQGQLKYTFPAGNGNPWVVMDFYQTADGQAESNVSPTGSDYVLDHLSAAGADAIGDYWDSNILNDKTISNAIKQTAKTVGTPAIFEDSLELSNDLAWTSDFGAQFQKLRGYPVDEALPVLAGTGIGARGAVATQPFTYSDGQTARMVNDYQQTYNDLYSNRYLSAMESWAESNNLTLRAQAYGAPVDAAEASTHIGIPEGEGLGFNGKNPDQDFKVIAAGANRTGAAIVSSECCAMVGQVWASTAAQNLTSEIYIDMAGGNNQIVWHGMPYPAAPSGSGTEASWPGFSFGGNTSFSEAWGPQMPQWADDKYLNDDISRMSMVLRQGKPSYDVGVYYQNLGLAGQSHDDTSTVVPDTSAMSAAGYTYGYADSSFLTDASKDYRNGVLFPGASDFHALVLNNPKTLKTADAGQILALAEAGLPIVIVGPAKPAAMGTPGYNTGGGDKTVQKDWNALYALVGKDATAAKGAKQHVVQVSSEAGVPAALSGLGVHAAAAHTSDPTSGSLLDVRRDDGATQYYYLYNNSAQPVDQRLTLTGKGKPYALNTWTGAVTPIAQYSAGGGTVGLDVHLGAHDAGVIALSTDADKFDAAPGKISATGTTADGAIFDTHGGLAITSTSPGKFSTTLSTGKKVTSAIADVPVASTLSSWSLSVDSWTAGPSDAPGDTAHTSIGPIEVKADPVTGALPAWTSITKANGYPVDLQDVAGTASYTTHLDLPSQWTGGRHAYLDLGSVTDTPEVTVNGKALPPVDFVDLSRIDLGTSLKAGDNTITVHVATPLINAVRVAPNTGATSRARTPNGMVGPVVLTPYGQTTVTTD